MFICISVTYDETAQVQITVKTPGKIVRGIASVKKVNENFVDGQLYVGLSSNTKYMSYTCDCYMSNFNWFIDEYYSYLIEILPLRRKDMRILNNFQIFFIFNF